jgi:hypothetical protein
MAKMNIYVTDEMKERMDAYELKWSQIASSAFEASMNLEDRKEVNMETASLERLRKSRDQVVDRRHADGVAAGKKWALEHAEFDELAAIATTGKTPRRSATPCSAVPIPSLPKFAASLKARQRCTRRSDEQSFCRAIWASAKGREPAVSHHHWPLTTTH